MSQPIKRKQKSSQGDILEQLSKYYDIVRREGYVSSVYEKKIAKLYAKIMRMNYN